MNAQGKITATKSGKVTTMTSREFNQHTGAAKAAADNGPVVVTDRGRPAYVLLSYGDYTRQERPLRSALDSIADPRPEADFDFEFERAKGGFRDVDFGFDD